MGGTYFQTYKICTVTIQRPPPSPSFTINFKITGESTPSHDDDESQIFSITSTVAMNQEQFLCREKAESIIGTSLRNWQVKDVARCYLISSSLSQAKLVVESMPAGHNHVNLHMHLTVICVYETPDSSAGMILAEVMTGNCSVCLEEFIDGNSDGVKTPCGHLFHRQCIRKWLRRSHCCPNCRFQMPTKGNQ